jgi:hypothetical protein
MVIYLESIGPIIRSEKKTMDNILLFFRRLSPQKNRINLWEFEYHPCVLCYTQ